MTTDGPRRFAALLLAGALLAAGGVAHAQDRRAPSPATASPANQAVLELLSEIERMRSLVQELRGQLEVQTHRLEQVRNQQRQAMADFDRRLRELEQRLAQQKAQAPSPAPAGSDPRVITTPPIGGGGVARAAPAPRPAPPTGPVARAATPTESEQQAYDRAFDLMKQGLYAQAAVRFREFLARFPQGALADNAQYWIGEAAYVTRDFRTALDEFGRVLTAYPDSRKVPDALLKIGYTYYELGEYAKARETLSRVMARYPNTAVAKSAELRVEKIAREGH